MTQRKVYQSKELVKSALVSLLEERELHEVTIKEIVERAEVHRGTFYNHFSAKEEVVEELITEVLEEVRLILKERLELRKDQVKGVLEKLFTHVYRHERLYRLSLSSSAFARMQFELCDVLREETFRDLEGETIPLPATQEFVANFYAHAITGTIREWVHGNFKYRPRYMADQLHVMLQDVEAKRFSK